MDQDIMLNPGKYRRGIRSAREQLRMTTSEFDEFVRAKSGYTIQSHWLEANGTGKKLFNSVEAVKEAIYGI